VSKKSEIIFSACRENDVVPERIRGHRIYTIQELLIFWPSPYPKARKNKLFEQGLKAVLKSSGFSIYADASLFSLGEIRSDNRKPRIELPKRNSHEPIFLHENRWGLSSYGFDIDFDFPIENTVDRFEKWLRAEKKLKPGRRKGMDVVSSLKKLSALRLWKRGDPGDGRGRFDRLSEALKAYQTKNPGPKEFSIELPIYEHPGGFTRAWNEGAEHAKTLNLIRVWDPKQQMQIEQDWDG